MAERRDSSTELLMAALAAGVLAIAGTAWRASTMDSIAGLRQRSALSPNDAALRAQFVQKLVDADRSEEAITLLRNRLTATPEDAPARRKLVDLLADHRQTPEAIQLLRQHLVLHGDDLTSRERLAELLLTTGNADDAIPLYRQVIAQAPQNVTAPYGLAKAFVLKHDDLSAQRTLEENLKKHPDDPASNELLADLAVKSLGETAFPIVQKYYERAIAGDPARPSAALGLAKIYVLQGRTADAAKVLARPAASDRKNAPLHLLYADVLSDLRRYGQAGSEYSVGTAYDPENAEAYYRWGKMLVASGSPAAAVTVLHRATAINESLPLTAASKRRSAEYHLQLGRALRDLRDLGLGAADFMAEFQTAIDCDPTYVNIYLEVADTKLKARQEGAAEKWLKDALVVAPTSTAAKVQLARLYMNPLDPARKNIDAAIALLAESVSETKSQDVSLLVGLASTLASVHRYDEAMEQMNVAIPVGRAVQLPAWQMEILASMQQEYFVATIPPRTEGEGRFGIEGRVVHEVWDDPFPDPLQPKWQGLARRPMDLSKPPAPGNALDPALYMGDALQRRPKGEFNGMPILDIMK